MKKIFLILGMLLYAFLSEGQSSKLNNQRSSFIITGGVSIPVVCYASKNINNEEAGFARLGFHVSMIYEFDFSKNVGVAGKLFYSLNKVDKKINPENDLASISNYKYCGLLIGPYFRHSLGANTQLNFKFLPGIIHVNSPTLSQQGSPQASANGATAFGWAAGTDIYYQSKGRNSFFIINSDFTSSKPHFTVPVLGDNVKIEQHIAVVNVTGGIGFHF